MGRSWRLLPGLLLLALGCAPTTPAEKLSAWREDAMSRRSYERVEPFLEDLLPGDDLRIFAGARRVYELGRGPRARPVVVMPAWISSLSGGAPGGLSLFGQLIARRDERIYGSHVFGFASGRQLVPRYQVLTAATLVDEQGFHRLAAQRTPGLGVLPRPSGTLHFRDLHVVGARPLDFPERPGALASALLPEGGHAALLSEAAWREVAPLLEALPEGTDLFSMLWVLEAVFASDDFGETHSLLLRGFLQTPSAHTRTREGPEGVFKLRPFGWIEDERVVVRRIAVFQNDRLQQVVPFRDLEQEPPGPAAPGGASDREPRTTTLRPNAGRSFRPGL